MNLKSSIKIWTFIFMISLLQSIVYASINSVSMNIEANNIISAPTDVFIYSVEVSNSNDANSYSVNSFSRTLINSDVELSDTNGNSSVTFKIQVANTTSDDYVFTNPLYEYGNETYSNSDIILTLQDISNGDIILPGEVKTFYVTFSYDNNEVASSNDLHSLINYKFIEVCDVGYYLNGNQCEIKTFACESGTYLPISGEECVTCTAGSYCPGGTYLYNSENNSGTFKCVSGSYSSDGAAACSACVDGMTTDVEYAQTCSTTCTNDENVTSWNTATWNSDNTVTNNCSIKTCGTGYELVNNECKIKTFTCNAGEYLPMGTFECIICPAGKYCPGGTYEYNTTTSRGINNCPANTYSASTGESSVNACISCNTENGYSSSAGATVCSLTTTAGKYVANANGAQVDCSAGGYCPGSVKVNQGSTGGRTECSTNTYNPNSSSTSSSDCVACNTANGYSSDVGASACTITTTTGKCVATANAALTNCPTGSYCPGNLTVVQGNTGGRNLCPTADSGWTATSPASSSSYSACYEYQTPTGCASGTVKRTASSSSTYSSTITLNSTLKSSDGYYASTSATSCTKCVAGYFCTAGSTTQTKCVAGTYSGAGAKACTVCGAGKTSTAGATAASSCTTCTNNSNVASWSTPTWSSNSVTNLCKISTCNAGYAISGTTCAPKTYTVQFNRNLYYWRHPTSGVIATSTESDNVLANDLGVHRKYTTNYEQIWLHNPNEAVGTFTLSDLDYNFLNEDVIAFGVTVTGGTISNNSKLVLEIRNSSGQSIGTRTAGYNYCELTLNNTYSSTQSCSFTVNSQGASDGTKLSLWVYNASTSVYNDYSFTVNAVLRRKVKYGSAYGTLPLPKVLGSSPTGWYDAETGGNKITATTIMNKTSDPVNLFARY